MNELKSSWAYLLEDMFFSLKIFCDYMENCFKTAHMSKTTQKFEEPNYYGAK